MTFITRTHDGELCYSPYDEHGNPIPREPCDQCRKDFVMANASSDTERQLLRELGRRDPACIRIITTDERADGLALAGTGRYERQDGSTKPFTYEIRDDVIVLLTPAIVAAQDYSPPDPYAAGIAKLRAAAATPESTFEDAWKRERLAELASEHGRFGAGSEERRAERLTGLEETSNYAPPDPYRAGLDKMRSEGR